MAQNINIGGRLHSTATGNIVTGANEVYDDSLAKNQSNINTETYQYVEDIQNALQNLSPDQQEAIALSGKVNELDKGLGVLNVNKLNNKADAYEDAQHARNAVGSDYKKLGLEITYLLSNGWFNDKFIGDDIDNWNDANNWQVLGPVIVSQNIETGKTELLIGDIPALIVDNEPETGSDNLVKSGGVANALKELNRDVLGTFEKEVEWSAGYVNYQGNIVSDTLSQFTQPLLLKKGETVTIGTTNSNITIIGTTTQTTLSVGDSITPIQRTSPTERYEEYSYTANEDMLIVLCVLASDFNLSFYYSENSSYMLEHMDEVPREGSKMLVTSGGVAEGLVSVAGTFKINNSVTSGQFKVLFNKSIDLGENIAIELKSMTCSLNTGKYLSVSLYKSNGETIYETLASVGEIVKRNVDNGVTFTGIYIAADSDVFATSGNIVIDIFFGSAYFSNVVVPANTAIINGLKLSQNSSGRELISGSVLQVNREQLVGQVSQPFGSVNNVCLRVAYNNATLGTGCKIKVYLYSQGSAFTAIELSEQWKIWKSSSADILVDEIIVVCDGEVTKAGDICVEIAYSDYYRAAVNPLVESLGTISLDGKSSSHPDGTAITKMLEHPIPLGEFAKILIKSSEFTLGEGADTHPSIYVYGVYSADGSVLLQLTSFSENGKITPVYTYDYNTLYGIYFWNNCNYSIEFDVSVFYDDAVSNITNVEDFDHCLQLPIYYNSYIEDRKKLIRSILRQTSINGDVFYFVTDTHWEFNQRNSPAIIKAMSELCIPRLFHGGDMYHRGLEVDKYNTKCLESYRKALGLNKVYEVDGNHEYYGGLATMGDVFAETRLMLDEVVYGGGYKNYYYFDNNPQKTRYIILYVYADTGNGVTNQGLCDRTQMTWFKDVALNVEEGYSIFIFAHFIYSRRPYGMPGGTYEEVPMLDPTDELNFYRIINEYSGNGNIIACINGHTHWDCISQNKCSCPIICTTSDHNYPFYQTVGADSFYDFMDLIEKRDSGTIKEQAFDTVIYDKDNSMLHLVRIGSRAMNRNNAYDGNAQVDIRTIVLTNMEIGNTITLNSELVIAAWESSDNSVASVSDGVVTANAAGYVVITGTALDGKKQSWFIKIV